jgi:hypothetical protein
VGDDHQIADLLLTKPRPPGQNSGGFYTGDDRQKENMHSQTNNHRWMLRPDVVSTVLNDGAVILDLRSKFFFSANPTGWAIAQMFESGATRAEVHAASRQWGANGADSPAIDSIIDQMISEGLVEPANATAAAVTAVAVAAWIPPTLSKHNEPLQRIMVSAFDPGLPLAE